MIALLLLIHSGYVILKTTAFKNDLLIVIVSANLFFLLRPKNHFTPLWVYSNVYKHTKIDISISKLSNIFIKL